MLAGTKGTNLQCKFVFSFLNLILFIGPLSMFFGRVWSYLLPVPSNWSVISLPVCSCVFKMGQSCHFTLDVLVFFLVHFGLSATITGAVP